MMDVMIVNLYALITVWIVNLVNAIDAIKDTKYNNLNASQIAEIK